MPCILCPGCGGEEEEKEAAADTFGNWGLPKNATHLKVKCQRGPSKETFVKRNFVFPSVFLTFPLKEEGEWVQSMDAVRDFFSSHKRFEKKMHSAPWIPFCDSILISIQGSQATILALRDIASHMPLQIMWLLHHRRKGGSISIYAYDVFVVMIFLRVQCSLDRKEMRRESVGFWPLWLQ